MAAERPADERSRGDDQPAVRLEPRRGDAGQPRDRDRRRLDRGRRRRRVDEPRAVGPAQDRARRSRASTSSCTRGRSGGGWSTRRCPSSGRSRSGRAPRSSRGSTRSRARRRTSSRCAATSARRRPGRTASTSEWVVPVPDTELERDENIRARHDAREAREAEARVRRGRDGHRRELLAAQRRRRRGAARRRGGRDARSGAEPLARIVSRGAAGGRSGRVRDRAGARRPTPRWSAPGSVGRTSPWSS